MSLIKIALTVLGTVGLTAGTVLAVAEPTPSSLPEAAANASACSGCQTKTCGTAKCAPAVSACANSATACAKDRSQASAAGPLTVDFGVAVQQATAFLDDATDSAARSGIADLTKCEVIQLSAKGSSCESGKCSSAASACSKTASACAKSCAGESPCQVNLANTIGGPINPEAIQQIAACSEVNAACTAAGCGSDHSVCSPAACKTETSGPCAKPKKKLTLSVGFGTNGPIIRLTSGEEPAPSSEHTCDGLAACLKNTFAACTCPAGTCEKESCEACSCEGKCEQTQQVATTACEAKPACAVAGCPTSACNVTACETSACNAGACKAGSCSSCPEGCETVETLAEDTDFSDSACSVAACDCKDCCCESCDCTTDTACPPGQICPVAVRLHRFQTTGILPNGIRLMATGIAPAPGETTCEGVACQKGKSCETSEAAEQPGRVRMTHLPGMPILPPGAQFQSAGFVSLWPQSLGAAFPAMACGAEFESPKTWPALRAASYAESAVEASHPSRRPVDGTWTRDIDGTNLTFTIEGDRLRGAVAGTVKFSGTCSVSKDGQVFGLLDEIALEEMKSMTANTAATRLLDQPFAFRFAVDDGDLIVKDFRCGGMDGVVGADGFEAKLVDYVAMFACGRFERSE